MGIEMAFIKLYDEEVLMLMTRNSIKSLGVYQVIRRCAYVDKKNPERSYWSFPTGLYIWKQLKLVDQSRVELTDAQNKAVGRCIDYLEEMKLIRVHRSLAHLDALKKDAKTRIEKRDIKVKYDLSVKVRDDLVEWGKLKKNTGKHLVFELVALRGIETQDRDVQYQRTEMSGTQTEMSETQTEMSSEEEELNKKNINTNTIINMNRETETMVQDWNDFEEPEMGDVRNYLSQVQSEIEDEDTIIMKIHMDGFVNDVINGLNWLTDITPSEQRILNLLEYSKVSSNKY